MTSIGRVGTISFSSANLPEVSAGQDFYGGGRRLQIVYLIVHLPSDHFYAEGCTGGQMMPAVINQPARVSVRILYSKRSAARNSPSDIE